MKKGMFYRASVKLTGLYLLIIMSISLIFSFGLYELASREIEQGIKRPNSFAQIIRLNDLEGLQDFLLGQDEAIDTAKRNLKLSLVLINLIILAGGGLLSYYLARLTLRPIENAHDAQSRFTSDASHELRTPIAAMRLENELALTDKKLSIKEAKDQFKSNIDELDKLTSLTEGLLQLARMEDENISKEKVEIKDVIEKAISRNQAEIDNKKQKVVWQRKNISIITNEEALTNTISILINNASKYSPDSSEIVIKYSVNKGSFRLNVADQGVGINPIDVNKIFDRFYRADESRTNSNENGYGIGLSIAKKSVEALGGKITVDSVPQKGSTFTVCIPTN